MVLTFRLFRKWILKGVSAIAKTIGEKLRTRGTGMLIDQSVQNRADEILSAEMNRRSSAKAYISFCEASLSDATEIEKNGDIRWFFVEKLIYQYSRELLAGRISEQEAMDKIGLISISELQKFGANPASSLGEGVVLFLQEDQELAQISFLDSSTFQFQSRRFHISRGASSYRSDSWLLRLSRDTHGSYIFRPKIDGLKKPQYIPEMIHFTSADSTYFHKFGPRFVLESISKGGFPHIHLVDASAKDIRLVEQMNSQFNMAFSFEEAPFLGELKYPKGYLISPRYLMLPEIMEHYDRPVLVTDIDSKPNFKFSEILDVSVGKDAMMRISDGHKKRGGVSVATCCWWR